MGLEKLREVGSRRAPERQVSTLGSLCFSGKEKKMVSHPIEMKIKHIFIEENTRGEDLRLGRRRHPHFTS